MNADAGLSQRAQVVTDYARPLIDGAWITGASVALVDPSGVEYVELGTLDGPGTPAANEDTVYEIGSITKTMTAFLLQRAVDAGSVTLAQPVKELLPPGVSVPNYNGREIQLVDLASHHSGLPRMPANFAPADPTNPYADYTAAMLGDFLAHYALPRAPGAEFEYSNVGAGLLGHALAVHANTSYEQLLATQLFGPLGMNDTAITLTPTLRARVAPGHDTEGRRVPLWDQDVLAPAGAVRSTLRDMTAYARANLGNGPADVTRALAEAHAIVHPLATGGGVGLGWHLRPDGTVWHNGGTGGYSSICLLDLSRHLAVVVLSNTFSPQVDKLGLGAMAILRGQNPAAWQLPPTASVSPDTLAHYPGTYRLSPTVSAVVSLDSDQRLWLQLTGQSRLGLYASAPTEFYLRAVDAQVSFVTDASGSVTSLVLHQNGRNTTATRVP